MIRTAIQCSVLLVWLLTNSVQAAEDRALFWQAHSPEGTAWLLGSIHLANAELYPLRADILTAFERADALVVELDVGAMDPVALQSLMLREGMYPGGESIRDHISAATWDKLEAYLRDEGLPPSMFVQQRPGLLMTSLGTIKVMQLGFSPQQGIDLHFLNRARGNKPIIALETMEEQLAALLDMPDPDLVVRQTLTELRDMERLMDEMLAAWKSGEAEALAALLYVDALAEHPEYAAVYDRLLIDRNRRMAARVAELVSGGKDCFVVVGAAHLVGPDSVVELLRERGFDVRQR